jgi:hypothetical protein
MRRVVLATVALALLAGAPTADARRYTLDKVVPGAIRTAAEQAKIPVRLPRTLDLDYEKGVFGRGGGDGKSFFLTLAATRSCGANVCSLGTISGERGGKPAFRRTVKLRNGITGYFKPLTCGASCSPPQIQWIQGGVLYDIQAKVIGGRGEMIRAANEAIASKPR